MTTAYLNSKNPANLKVKRNSNWLLLSFIIIIIDQLTKYWISKNLSYGIAYKVTSFFNLLWINNNGTAWGLLSQQSGWQRWFLALVAIIVSIYVINQLLRKNLPDPWFCCALSFILGGALGNLIDRIYLGRVIDFIQLHAFNYAFAVFNVADIAVTIGAFLLITMQFFVGQTHNK